MVKESRPFIRACFKQPTDRVPVWMMRQAGRYQPEYLALKERVGGFWGLCTSPDAIAEATLFAQASLDTDAAIIFSDITVPAWAMGLELEFSPGPRFSKPVRTRSDVDALKDYDPAVTTSFLMEGIRKTRAGLPDACSLIGFVGAPLTLAGYMIEGYPGRHWLELKRLAYQDTDVLEALLERLVATVVRHARAQVEAGCDCIQLFDSTAGQLAADALHRFAFASAKAVLGELRDLNVPLIYFARDVGAHLERVAELGAHVIGLDWSVSVGQARKRLGDDVALMGNLDPAVLFYHKDVITERAQAILRQAEGHPGFVFNLGHGILPQTPPEHARHLVDVVHAWGR